MTTNEQILLELLVSLNSIESRCQRLNASVAVPPGVYVLIGQLRDKIAQWGIDNVVEERRREPAPSTAFRRDER